MEQGNHGAPRGRSSDTQGRPDATSQESTREACAFEWRDPSAHALEHLPACVYVKDPNRRIQYANSSFRSLFGDPSGRCCFELLPQSTEPCPSCGASLALESGGARYWDCVCSKGRTFRNYASFVSGRGGEPWILSTLVDVTSHKQALRDVQDSERRYRLLAENSADVIAIVDHRNVFTYVSPSSLVQWGYDPADLDGESVEKIFPTECGGKLDRFRHDGLDGGESPASLCLETTARRSDGAEIWLEVSAAALPNGGRDAGIMLVSRDVTARKHAEQNLAKERDFIRTILRNSSDGAAVVSRDGSVQYLNPAMDRLTGMSQRNFRTVQEWIDASLPDEEGRRKVYGYWERDLELEYPPERVFQIIDQDGKEGWRRFKVAHTEHGDVVINGQDITDTMEADKRIRHLALHDPLTDLPNRQLFHDRLEMALKQARRRDAKVALLFVDLDRFKAMNDTHGHAFGDKALVEASRRLQHILRQSDTVARMGGDEFIIILPDLANGRQAAEVAHRVTQVLFQPEREKDVYLLGASVGVAVFPDDARDADVLLSKADTAMYQAKGQGGNRCCFAAEAGEKS